VRFLVLWLSEAQNLRCHFAVFYQRVRGVFGHMARSFGRLDVKMPSHNSSSFVARNRSSFAASLSEDGLAEFLSIFFSTLQLRTVCTLGRQNGRVHAHAYSDSGPKRTNTRGGPSFRCHSTDLRAS
jgi:hypothetical protein